MILDLTTSAGIEQTRTAFIYLRSAFAATRAQIPQNSKILRRLDCAVINSLHQLREVQGINPIQTVRGVFVEGEPAYEGAGFDAKTHVQIAVRDLKCIKGVFRALAHVMSDA